MKFKVGDKVKVRSNTYVDTSSEVGIVLDISSYRASREAIHIQFEDRTTYYWADHCENLTEQFNNKIKGYINE